MQDPNVAPITTREPLAIRAAIVAAITAVLEFLIAAGYLTLTADARETLMIAVGMVGTAILVLWTRGKVTPIDAPVLPETGDTTGTTTDPDLEEVDRG